MQTQSHGRSDGDYNSRLKDYAATVLESDIRDPRCCADDIWFLREKLRERVLNRENGAKVSAGVNRSTRQERKVIIFDKIMNITRIEKAWDGKGFTLAAQLGNMHVTISGLTEKEVRDVDITKPVHICANESQLAADKVSA